MKNIALLLIAALIVPGLAGSDNMSMNPNSVSGNPVTIVINQSSVDAHSLTMIINASPGQVQNSCYLQVGFPIYLFQTGSGEAVDPVSGFIGDAQVLESSVCKVYLAESSYELSGGGYLRTYQIRIEMKPGYTGAKQVYGQWWERCWDEYGWYWGWMSETLGTWSSADTTPPVISGVTHSGITASSATISWTTDEASDTQVDYGTTTAYGLLSALNSSLVTSHAVGLTGLSPGTGYYYRVRSGDASTNLGTQASGPFTTQPPPDTTPPVISGVTHSSITSSSATISWTTNEASDTQVEYGTTTSYGSVSSLNPAMVTSHSVNLTGLVSSTTYYYRTRSRDAASNLGMQAGGPFTTVDVTPPVISGVTQSGITTSAATISWSTNEASDTQVEYGTTTSYGSLSSLNPAMVTSHSVNLTGLA